MLTVNRLGEDAGRYYRDGPVTGRWCGGGRRDLGLDGAVSADALAAVLHGQRPDDGAALSARRTAHRRGGWDLIFSAPKSVSLLAALAPDDPGELIGTAHRRACADAFGWLEANAAWARRQGGLVATSGFVAARFGHRLNAAGEPHLHTHVLIANVVRAGDERWSAVDGSGLWLNRRAVAGIYHLALRQQLLAAGLRPDWVIGPDGAADVAAVPRGAVDATSTRRHQILRRLSETDELGPRGRVAAGRLTRREATNHSWAERSGAAGLGPDDARVVIERAAQRAVRAVTPDAGRDPRLVRDVTEWLAGRRSTFGRADIIQALSATHAEGTTASEAERWATAFHDASPLAPDGRRTSALAQLHDDDLVRLARAHAGTHGLDILASPRPLDRADGWRVTSAKGGFVPQTDVVDAARLAWQRAGRTVRVATTSAASARRWRALTGLDRHRAGEIPPEVLIVDRADRRSTRELTEILDDASRHGTRLVLVEGGTLPARRVAMSMGLVLLAAEHGRVVPAGSPGSVTPPSLVTAGHDEMREHGCHAADRVVAAWSAWRRDGPDGAVPAADHPGGRARTAGGGAEPPRMVAFGPAECDELNRRARDVLRADGAITGTEIIIAGRPFATGDAVVATRRGAQPAGALGEVREVDPGGSMVIRWQSGPAGRVDAWNGRHLRHAYAGTPGMMHFDHRPIILLGDPGDLGQHRDRIVAAVLVAPAGPGPERDRRAVRASTETPLDVLALERPTPQRHRPDHPPLEPGSKSASLGEAIRVGETIRVGDASRVGAAIHHGDASRVGADAPTLATATETGGRAGSAEELTARGRHPAPEHLALEHPALEHPGPEHSGTQHSALERSRPERSGPDLGL